MPVLEIRSYNLKLGARDAFLKVFEDEGLPLLAEWGTDVVNYGASAHDEDSAFLMRRYEDLADRERRQDAFYGSDAWKLGPRERILAPIVAYTTVVLELDDAAVDALRRRA